MLRRSVFCLATSWIVFALPVSVSSERLTPTDKGVIVVWKVGSPLSGEVPDTIAPRELKLRAEEMGLRLEIQGFSAKDFAQQFFAAFNAHQEPDVVAAEYVYTIEGPGTNPYGVVGIATDPNVRRSLIQVIGSLKELVGGRGGWQFLISTSKNYESARRLALRPPECEATSVRGSSMPSDIQKAAMQITDAYLRSPGEVNLYNDPDRLVANGVRWKPIQVRETRACGFWGNDRLAFASLVASFEPVDTGGHSSARSVADASMIGQTPILLVLRKEDANWRLLAASSDPISNGPFLRQLPVVFRSKCKTQSGETGLEAAQIRTPDNGSAPLPEPGQRFGNFTWQPSDSANVVAELVEFAYENDARLFLKKRQDNVATAQISEGSLWRTGTEWKWRVWTISNCGAIAFSEARSFHQ